MQNIANPNIWGHPLTQGNIINKNKEKINKIINSHQSVRDNKIFSEINHF